MWLFLIEVLCGKCDDFFYFLACDISVEVEIFLYEEVRVTPVVILPSLQAGDHAVETCS
jgi:hypothetical protein